ncbi:T9SS type A sorting domain-containing protein [Flavobacterium sp. N1736]|uniref:T9SS type A sorting domain-containing protein n=1 Tax=Flavobacterium sp. N1736 TaxID=2986823 RepID=UPI0022250160|nr:T9SS type A sorting domain-containing protein [Flavobacterium sp. N1736]
MKKTLLFFLFLFTTIFHAQVSNIEHCSGETAFNLTSKKAELIGNLNPAETTVSYHLSLASATNNTNALPDPTYYIAGTSLTTIYARINNNGNITTNYFNLIIHNYLSVTPSLTPIACNGRTADLTINASGGSGSYKYSLNGGEFITNNVFLGLRPGVKNFDVIDTVTGCTRSFSYTITEPAVVAAIASVNKNTITVTASGGFPPYQYSIDGDHFKSSNVFTNVSPGNYNIIVIDSPACRTYVAATVQPPLSSTAVITKQLDCLGTGTASITANGVGGKTPYSYSLNGGAYQTNNIFNNLTAGTYTVTVTDAENTVSTPTAITIQAYSPIAITWNNTNLSCIGSNDGTAVIMATGGVAPYSYSIDNGAYGSGNVFNNLSASNHTISVKDATGCGITSFLTILQPDPILINESVVNSSVNNDGSITIAASGGSNSYLYSLKDATGNVLISQQASNVFSGLSVGSYKVEVIDSRGCFSVKDVTIAALSTLAVNVTVGNVTCDNLNGSITIVATGGVAPYRYSIDDGVNYYSSTVYKYLDLKTYSVKVKDAQNTVVSTTATVTQATTLTISAKTQAASIACNGDKTGVITATATGGLQPYKYSIDGITFQSAKTFYNLKAGSYNVTVKDANGCMALINIAVTQRPALSATAKIVNDQNIVITPDGGTTLYTYYLENTTTGTELGPETIGTFTKLPVGVYTAKVLDSNGCLFTIPGINIQAPSSTALAAISVVDPAGCVFNGRITIAATGGREPYSYSINNGTNYSSSNVFSSLTPNTYTVKVRDADLNTTSHSVKIDYKYPPSIYADVTNVSCKGSSTGSITVISYGGAGPFQFSLNGGTYFYDSPTFNNLAAGTYNISVRDNNICESTLTVVVTEPTALSATAFASANQGIVANASGGTAPYSYSVENGSGAVVVPSQSNNTFTNLPIGLYTVKVIDAHACTTSVSNINVVASTPLSATAIATNVTCSNPGGTVTFTTSGGITPYQYSIDNGANYSASNTFTNLTAGNYSLKVKDALNTVVNLNATIAQTTPLKVFAQILTPVNCNGDTSGLIFCTATGGSGLYQYSIDGIKFQGSRYFTNLKAGTYTITLKDYSDECVAITTPITLTDPPVLSATAVVNGQTVSVSAVGGTGTYGYYLENTATGDRLGLLESGKFPALAPGNYTAKAVDSRGCFFNIPGIIVQAPSSTALTVVSVVSDQTCSTTGRVTLIATGGTPPYQYSLNNGSTYSASNLFVSLPPFTYAAKVRDSNLNTVTESVTVNPVWSVIRATAAVTNVSCQGNNNGIITVTATGGKAPYSYSINGEHHTNANTFYELSPGTYVVGVSDQNSCDYTLTVEVKEPAPLKVTATMGAKQSITANVFGGTAPFSYSLTDKNGVTSVAQTSNKFTNVPVGLYTLNIVDVNACSVSLSNVNVLPDPLAAIATINQVTCDNPTGTITVTAMGGSGVYQYSIDNEAHYYASNVFSNLQPGNYTITVKDSLNNVFTFNAVIIPVNPVHLNATITSQQSCTGPGTIEAIAAGGQAPYVYSLNGGAYLSATTFSVYAGVYTVTVKDINGCTDTVTITVEATPFLVASVIVENQTITVTTTGGSGVYDFSLDGGPYQSSNVFTNLSYGIHQVYTRDQSGCIAVNSFAIDPPAPVIDGEKVITIEFTPGQTLGDLVIQGQNIKWYSTSGSLPAKASKSAETTLPLSTILVDGTTYYASQTINGIESTERLAVTAKVKGSLSTPDFVLANFTYYPNPVQHTLSISNTSNIDEVEIISVSGKSILTKKINNTQSEIDLSNVSSGFYFLKVKSEGKTKTIKIVKK